MSDLENVSLAALFDADLDPSDVTELIGLIRCHYGYHVWPGEPWDHCMRCFIRYPEQALNYYPEGGAQR